MKKMLVAVVVLLAPITASAQLAETLEKAKISAAQTQIKLLDNAVTLYRLNNNSFPQKLERLLEADPNNASQPYLKERTSLIDPWNKPYQYDAEGPKNKGLTSDIWTVTPDKKTLGNWPAE